MSNRSWLERVAIELVRRRVPAVQRSRLLSELRDHIDDLTEGGSRMTHVLLEDVLGEPAAVANQAAEAYGKGVWIRRHPLLLFGIAPLPAALLGLTLYLLLAIGVAWLWEQVSGSELRSPEVREMAGQAFTTFAYTVGIVPFAVCAALFGQLAMRAGASRWWLGVAVAQVALVAWMVVTAVTLSDLPGKSTFSLGLIQTLVEAV